MSKGNRRGERVLMERGSVRCCVDRRTPIMAGIRRGMSPVTDNERLMIESGLCAQAANQFAAASVDGGVWCGRCARQSGALRGTIVPRA